MGKISECGECGVWWPYWELAKIIVDGEPWLLCPGCLKARVEAPSISAEYGVNSLAELFDKAFTFALIVTGQTEFYGLNHDEHRSMAKSNMHVFKSINITKGVFE